MSYVWCELMYQYHDLKLLRCCSELCLLFVHVFHCQARMSDFCSLELNIIV
uniref:Uncharacterized protein n=1 Tax=Arundo donax TaxID=35708 RepID=A0A0A9EK82_ARUDO